MKFTFKNNILNIVIGSIFCLFVTIQIIGIFVPELNYIGKALKYIIGAFTLIAAGFNLGRNLRRNNKTAENIIWLIGNLIIIVLGILLMFLKQEDDKVWLTPSIVAGIDIYLEGVMLIITSTISNKTSIASSLVGILFISLGMICFFKLVDNILIWGFTAVLLILGLIFLLDGIYGLRNNKHQKEEKPKEKDIKKEPDDVKEVILEDVDEIDNSQAVPKEVTIKDVDTISYEEPNKEIENEKTHLIGQLDDIDNE